MPAAKWGGFHPCIGMVYPFLIKRKAFDTRWLIPNAPLSGYEPMREMRNDGPLIDYDSFQYRYELARAMRAGGQAMDHDAFQNDGKIHQRVVA